MIWKPILGFLGSQLFQNIVLVTSIVIAFAVGYKQILINDIVELYVTTGLRSNINIENKTESYTLVFFIQNVGTRVVYLDKYIFNGREYKTNGQILPSTYSQAQNASYWIELPTNGEKHVSLSIYYHDLDNRQWKSDVEANFSDNTWKVSTFPRAEQ